MRVSLIAAIDRNRLIGKTGGDFGLPWDLPDDRKYFKDHTVGKPMIEGRKTYEATKKLLPNRTTIIVTRDRNFLVEGALIAHSVDEALELAQTEALTLGVDEIMVSGGGQIFTALLPKADRLYLTEIDGEFAGDAYFPKFDRSEWTEVVRTHHPTNDRHAYAFDFAIYDRVTPSA
ncbi:dihydrofolate reductase [Candidatus Berkelbacteria bacterium]|nr:dihydrofolate reductase [Candidatus Berkelbacteria bacterium]